MASCWGYKLVAEIVNTNMHQLAYGFCFLQTLLPSVSENNILESPCLYYLEKRIVIGWLSDVYFWNTNSNAF